ncbi:MAG: tryptophan 2,3-dioxygenase [Chloroflexi bacterium]|nr:MAG: tryptophan 2,3-dioxygenase [Chloroflexota bacterium]
MDQPAAGGTEYAEYLLIDDLLRLQCPLTPGADDELLFIVVHQVYELWFKLLLAELSRARDLLAASDANAAVGLLQRVSRIDRLLVEQLAVLETMSPDEFLRFRDPLAPASGFQSRQFRAIERISGDAGDGGGGLWDAFCACGRGLGLDLPAGEEPLARSARLAALAGLYHEHRAPGRAALHRVAELLLDHDETIAAWRFRHTLMAARAIGSRPGTGGSKGVGYLRGTIDQRFFPELWEVRNRL